MPKKIIAIVSSPRNGNSEILVDQFIAGAKSVGHEAEKICLREKNIHVPLYGRMARCVYGSD